VKLRCNTKGDTFMVIIENIHISNIPCLHVVKHSLKHEKSPIVIFIHGYTSAKEHNLHYAYILAEAGIRVVLPDTIYHGEREESISEMDKNMKFWEIVIHTIYEIAAIKDHFIHQELVDEGRIGLAGTSMGGIITLGALTQYNWIQAAVCLMGNPYYEKFAVMQVEHFKKMGIQLPLSDDELKENIQSLRPYDLSLAPEKTAGRPIMFWHGEKDEVVPFIHTYRFYENVLKPLYSNNEENLRFIRDPKAGHKVTREGLLATVDWFKKNL
jgi:uncharacterized protein